MKNRRQFLNLVVRGGILSAIAVVSGGMIHRWTDADECRRNFACGDCGVSGQCGLPAADQHRLEKARKNPARTHHGQTGK